MINGFKADGSYECIAAFDPSILPPDILDEVSNNMLTTQFNDVHASITAPVDIKDNSPLGVTDSIVVPDLGVSQGISVTLDIANSDISQMKVTLTAPDNSVLVLYDKSGKKGDPLKATYNALSKLPAGDLGAWTGPSPKGAWKLTIIDSGFCDANPTCGNTLDGKLNSWSIGVKNLSSTKVAANGAFQFKNAAAPPIACNPANFGSAYANPKDNALYICNGKDFFPSNHSPPT